MRFQKLSGLLWALYMSNVIFKEVWSQCLPDQQELMVQLKNSVKYDSFVSVKIVNWDDGIDCCRWTGVSCSNGGHVIGLNLSHESISDGLNGSSTIFQLLHLQSLDLSDNSLGQVQIPLEFRHLANLTNLNLTDSGFAGQVPSVFLGMSKLVTLDLSTSSFSTALEMNNPGLKIVIQNLTSLKELRLDHVNLSVINGNDWSQLISTSLPDLQVLSLAYCSLLGPLDSSLGKLRSLSTLRLDGNNFSSPVPEAFQDFHNLKVLTLSRCGLYGTLPENIFKIMALEHVDLTGNGGLRGSLPEFAQNSALQTLAISGCNFTGSIPDSIGNLTRLISLDLSSNRFNGSIPSFSFSKNIQSIYLGYNYLSGELASSYFEGLKDLFTVELQRNLLSGQIPASLFSLPSLRILDLSINNLSGQIREHHNVSSSLENLALNDNNLEGPIPEFLFEFHSLATLDLSRNKLNGSVVFTRFREMMNLSRLDLSYNSLTVDVNGSESEFSLLPHFYNLMLASCNIKTFPYLKNQSTLTTLDLSNNQITGEIPNWLWEVNGRLLRMLNLSHNHISGLQEPYRFPSLHYLDLRSNQLHGQLPLPPSSAAYVDFSNNNFTGSLPVEVGNHLSFVGHYFSVANNNLVGSIPLSLCNATQLEVLDLSNNSLSGSIPTCLIGNAETLGVINLRRNSLSGNIPQGFPPKCVLETLDLSWNNLTGNIPKSLTNCLMLKVLNLGNNQITDTFPCSLRSLSSLQVLALRANGLHGEITCPDDDVSWQNIQILDLASNRISGALPPKFFLDFRAMMINQSEAQSRFGHLSFGSVVVGRVYYQDTVTLVLKGQEVEPERTITTLTVIDLSSNSFERGIPREIGDLQSLHLLNLSHNTLTGQIPESIGNLKQLESLDLSSNMLSGDIPEQLASLTFLSVLNLSYNLLDGRIPQGPQLQTFQASSFEGNKGLCGLPLNRACNVPPSEEIPGPSLEDDDQLFSVTEISLSVASGFVVGLGCIFGPLLLSKKWRRFYNKYIDLFVLQILRAKGK